MKYKFEIEEEEFEKLKKEYTKDAVFWCVYFIGTPILAAVVIFGSTLFEESLEGDIAQIVSLCMFLFCVLLLYIFTIGTTILYNIQLLRQSKIIPEQKEVPDE